LSRKAWLLFSIKKTSKAIKKPSYKSTLSLPAFVTSEILFPSIKNLNEVSLAKDIIKAVAANAKKILSKLVSQRSAVNVKFCVSKHGALSIRHLHSFEMNPLM
jgi:hypothetical protein